MLCEFQFQDFFYLVNFQFHKKKFQWIFNFTIFFSEFSSIGFVGKPQKSTKEQFVSLGTLERSSTWWKRSNSSQKIIFHLRKKIIIFSWNWFSCDDEFIVCFLDISSAVFFVKNLLFFLYEEEIHSYSCFKTFLASKAKIGFLIFFSNSTDAKEPAEWWNFFFKKYWFSFWTNRAITCTHIYLLHYFSIFCILF